MELAFKLDGDLYEVDRITLGDARLISRLFGVSDITQYDWTNADYLAALVYLGYRDKNRHLTHDQIMAKVEGVDLAELAESVMEAVAERAEAESADPTEPQTEADETPKKKRSAKAD